MLRVSKLIIGKNMKIIRARKVLFFYFLMIKLRKFVENKIQLQKSPSFGYCPQIICKINGQIIV